MKYFVYVVFDGQNRKIGFSRNVQRRLISLQIGNPRKLTIEYVSQYANKRDAMYIEKQSHLRLAAYHASGEWFNAQLDNVVKAIESRDWFTPHIEPIKATTVQANSGGFVSIADLIIKANPGKFI